MGEETKETNNDFKSAIENIDKKLDEKISEGFSRIESKLQTRDTREDTRGKEKDDDFVFDDTDEDGFVTKKDFKNLEKKLLDSAEKKSKTIVEKTLESKESKANRDWEALKKWPKLNKNSDEFDMKFAEDVAKEMSSRINRGRKENDPDLLYDSASHVSHEWLEKGMWAPKHLAERERRETNNQDDDFQVNGRRQANSGKPNENQTRLAARFGMSKERLTQIFEKRRVS